MCNIAQVAMAWITFVVVPNTNGFGYSKKGMSTL